MRAGYSPYGLPGPRPCPSDGRSWAVISTGRKLARTSGGVVGHDALG